jgi:hypothetical protein
MRAVAEKGMTAPIARAMDGGVGEIAFLSTLNDPFDMENQDPGSFSLTGPPGWDQEVRK